MSNSAKLAHLRAKTDRDLSLLIERDMDRRLALAEVGYARGTALHAEAEKACRRFDALLLKTPGMRRGARIRVGAKLRKLRLILDRPLALARAGRAPVASGG